MPTPNHPLQKYIELIDKISIINACLLGDIDSVAKLLERRVSVDTTDAENRTLLYMACDKKNTEMVKLLLRYNPDVEIKSNQDLVPFNRACYAGVKEVAQLLLEYGANINKVDATGFRPLHAALSKNNKEIIDLLLTNKAELTPANGLAILYFIYITTHDKNVKKELIIKFLDAGVSIDQTSTIKNTRGVTLLYAACKKKDIDMVELLIKRGANLQLATEEGKTAFHIACEEGDLDIVKLLHNTNKVDVNKQTANRETPLYVACREGKLDVVKFLFLNCKAVGDINIATIPGFTPLRVACVQGHVAIAKLLIANGAEVHTDCLNSACNLGDKNKEIIELLLEKMRGRGTLTPEHLVKLLGYTSGRDGNLEIVKLLLAHGADVNQTYIGKTPLEWASVNNRQEVIEVLRAHAQSKEKTTSQVKQVQKGDTKQVKEIKKQGKKQGKKKGKKKGKSKETSNMQKQKISEDVSSQPHTDTQLLEAVSSQLDRRIQLLDACRKGNIQKVRVLLQIIKDINIVSEIVNEEGFTLLHIVCMGLHSALIGAYKEIAELLLGEGMDVNILTKNNLLMTPLHVACHMGNEGLVQLLTDKSAELDIKMNGNLMPIHVAAVYKNKKADNNNFDNIIKKLLEAMAVIQNDFILEDALFIACKYGLADLTSKLREKVIAVDNNKAKENDPKLLYLAWQAIENKKKETLDWEGIDKNYAGKTEDYNKIVKIIKKSNPNALYDALCLACEKKDSEFCQWIIINGVEFKDLDNSILFNACKTGSVEIFTQVLISLSTEKQKQKSLLNKKADDKKENDGMTLLCLACQMGNKEIVELLINSGADVNISNKHGDTPLHIACKLGHKEIAELLIENKAKFDKKNKADLMPIHVANTTIIAALLTKMIKLNSYTYSFLIEAFHIVCEKGQENEQETVIKQIRTVDPKLLNELMNGKGKAALHFACKKGDLALVKLLINEGADVDTTTQDDGETPLHIACEKENLEIVECLLKSTKNVSISNTSNGWTPLHIACWRGNVRIVNCLLKAGADIHALTTDTGKTPLALAYDPEVRKLLTSKLTTEMESKEEIAADSIKGDVKWEKEYQKEFQQFSKLKFFKKEEQSSQETKPEKNKDEDNEEKDYQLYTIDGALSEETISLPAKQVKPVTTSYPSSEYELYYDDRDSWHIEKFKEVAEKAHLIFGTATTSCVHCYKHIFTLKIVHVTGADYRVVGIPIGERDGKKLIYFCELLDHATLDKKVNKSKKCSNFEKELRDYITKILRKEGKISSTISSTKKQLKL